MMASSAHDDNPTTCTIWSTCPPGLEELAKDEALEMLADLSPEAEASRGRLICQVRRSDHSSAPVDQLKRFLDLRIAANHFFVFHECRSGVDDFSIEDSTKEASLEALIGLVNKANWPLAMRVWRLFFHEPTGRHSGVTHVGHEPAEVVADEKTAAEAEEGDKRVKDPTRLSFRCTCYRNGRGHSFQSMEAAAAVGGELHDRFAWNVDLKDYDIEVVVWIEGPLVRLCLSLNRVCMDFRGQLVDVGSSALRATIAAGMLRMCRPKPGEIVCDCVCGSGSIPLEAWTTHPGCLHLAGDCHPIAVGKTQANIEHWCGQQEKRPPVSLVRWDMQQFPMRPGTVDVFLADLPFGKRQGSVLDNRTLYPTILAAMARCSPLGTGRACLLSGDRRNLMKTVSQMSTHWNLARTTSVGMGGMTACLVLLKRTAFE